ncbi:UDP-forming cellulose synthase catalytic subunit [Solimonas marina]|uniref:Cellulose synthase catalytic subunit [UDP-forming] n=1 Tax=Solimonas marina TaxID=2714601 RepID=A0A969WE69_9GAMM|nr:UDP-forming cellulose synthase catalytic subunit [Solimonas marina]NKF23731.1 UDP-forming cellulose synthase catalytic subunit [Solimonas marina]
MRLLSLLLIASLAIPVYALVTAPLSLFWQTFTAIGMVITANLLIRLKDYRWALAMMGLSTIASTRYLYWRLTQTLPIGPEFNAWDLFLSLGLVGAEIYAYVILILGFVQTIWPLHRKPAPLPDDPSQWPTVDIYIPTYNEPLAVVRPTVLAALAMDWPRDKFRVYVLDDGRRDEFRQFCETVGVTHVTRTDNKHAKAGNINAALKKTGGEYIAIFDCDHIPVRSFLQMTMGSMLQDKTVSLVQTPHHFFSPDPFEKNLATFRKVPNEGELFYGLIQDGNDFWDASFFCGSCAVLRREALEQIGGIATETVTEDAHTSLRMHTRGWKSAYINIPQAAGLATESLSAHVGQRIRWARGMAQIFRVNNPMVMPGLKFGQRICYSNAMLHFFYGLPRLIFLTSPLAYLLLGAEIIKAQGWMVLAYAAPHVMLATTTNSRLQGPFRHSFWAEIYETVLATFILVPTLLAVINPKLGKFNVTAKGGIVDRDYFDKDIARPYYLLFSLNLIGFTVGIIRLLIGGPHADTLMLNIGWTVYNLIIAGGALAVANEKRQVRSAVRVRTKLQAAIRSHADSGAYMTETLDVSYSGVALRLPEAVDLKQGDSLQILLMPERNDVWLDAKVMRAGRGLVAAKLNEMSIPQESALVQALFGRADAWIQWREHQKPDRPLRALFEVGRYGIRGGRDFFAWVVKAIWQRGTRTAPTKAA